jgi:hypothetical protein
VSDLQKICVDVSDCSADSRLTSYVGMPDDMPMAVLSVEDLIDMAGGIIPLSQRLGVARTTVHDWKRLGVVPGSRIAQISRELNIPPAWLLGIIQPPRTMKAAA